MKGKIMTENTPTNPPEKRAKVKLKSMAPPPAQKPPAALISDYRKRQQVGPFVIWGLVVLMVFIGIILLVVWFTSGNGPKITLFATATPTSTLTPTATNTATFTATSTVTSTASITPSPTPDKPFEYVVQEGDTLSGIAEKFNLGDFGIQFLFELNPEIDPANPNITIGQKIQIANPGYQLPTSTAVPSNLPAGTRINYVIRPGDTIAGIASLFNSTFEAILKENKIAEADANKIFVGQTLVIPANIVTPTAPPNPTITAGPSPTPPSPFTPTPPGGVAPTVTPSPTN